MRNAATRQEKAAEICHDGMTPVRAKSLPPLVIQDLSAKRLAGVGREPREQRRDEGHWAWLTA
jgi:hypothetical protein